MLSLVCLLLQLARPTLGATPEWKEYTRELAKHRCVRVTVYFAHTVPLDARLQSFELTFKANGDFFLVQAPNKFKWVKNRGIWIDDSAKTWRTMSDLELLRTKGSMLGLMGNAETTGSETWDAAWKMTRIQYAFASWLPKNRTGEVGYRFLSYSTDTAYAQTWWFDKTTHLITEVELQNIGPMVEDSIVRSGAITYIFDKAIDSKIDPNPPLGYAHVK